MAPLCTGQYLKDTYIPNYTQIKPKIQTLNPNPKH